MKASVALFLLLLSNGGLRAQVRLTETLKKAIVEEESKHDLPAAVADYQQVVAAFDEERKIAATALFRLAECQRKLHHDEQARAAYERVARDFSDQAELVEQSRAILASVYKVTVAPRPAVSFAVDTRADNARQRYRKALEDSLELAEARLGQVDGEFRGGMVGAEQVAQVKEQILKLKRDLAAFDMGIIPDK